MSIKDIKKHAYKCLSDNVYTPIFGYIIAGLLGGADTFSVGFSFNFGPASSGQLSEQEAELMMRTVLPIIIVIFAFSFLISVGLFILGSVIEVGYAKFNINIVEGIEVKLRTIFAYFPYFKTALFARFLVLVKVLGGLLLFIVPGFIEAINCAFVPHVLADNPELSAKEALEESERLMEGVKGDFFRLCLSFIGWILLCFVTFGFASLWVIPYMNASVAEFYRQIKKYKTFVIKKAD